MRLETWVLVLIGVVAFVSCVSRIENQDIEDYGVKQVGENLYLKKVLVGRDRVYFLVDKDGNVVSGTSSNWKVSSNKSSHIESATLIVK